jgi:hypothetical protein
VSYLDELRNRLDKAMAEDTIDLEIPRTGGIVVRCRALTQDQVDKLGEVKKANLAANARVIAGACVGLYQRLDDDTLEPLTGAGTEAPTFGSDVMFEALGVPTHKNVADVVLAMYSPVPLAIAEHAGRVVRHSGLAGAGALEALQGE